MSGIRRNDMMASAKCGLNENDRTRQKNASGPITVRRFLVSGMSENGETWTLATDTAGWSPRHGHTSVVFDGRCGLSVGRRISM